MALLVGWALVSVPSFAQDASLRQQLAAALERVDAKTAELTKLAQDLQQGDGAMLDEATLRHQIAGARSSLSKALEEAGSLLVQLETSGAAVPERTQIEALCQRLALDWKLEVDRLEVLWSGLRKRLDEGGAEAEAVEPKASELRESLIAAYQAYAGHLEQMQALRLDVASVRAALGERLDGIAKALVSGIAVVERRAEALESRFAESPDDAELETELQATKKKLERYTGSLRVVADLLDDLGRDATLYHQTLIEATGEITTDVLNRGVAFGLVQRWTGQLRDAAIENGPGFLFKAIVFLAILLFFRVLANVTHRVVDRAVTTSRLSLTQLARSMVVSLASRGVFVLGFLVALSQLGVALGPLLAGLGVAGFIVGFALQDTLGNFAAGAMILVYRPYDVGDMVEAAGVFGNVSAMSLVSTTILTIDNQTMVVPNSAIWGNVIKNVTAQKQRRVDLVFGIGYRDDIQRAEQVLTSILEEHPKVLEDPEPIVKLYNLGESSVDFVVRPWCATEDYWDVHWDVTREVKMRFDREGIGIPFPQRDVHLYHAAAPEEPV
jgi:small conductance mechanosensitive channel